MLPPPTDTHRVRRVAADPGKEATPAGESTTAPSPPPPVEKVEDAAFPAPSLSPAVEEVENGEAPDPAPPVSEKGEDAPVGVLLRSDILSPCVIPNDTLDPF